MSASERLAALGAVPKGTAAQVGAAWAVLDALPEIVAVVEAAEASGDYIIGSKFSIEQPFVSERIRDIRAALAALEEKLKP